MRRADADGDKHVYTDADVDRDSGGDLDGDIHEYDNADEYSDKFTNEHADRDGHCHRDGNSYIDRFTDSLSRRAVRSVLCCFRCSTPCQLYLGCAGDIVK